MENASLKTADRAAEERTRLMKEINFDLDLLTLYELKSVLRIIKVKYHL